MKLPGTNLYIPYVFVRDDAFALTNIEYPKKKNYNYRVSRTRRVVESAFRILANYFSFIESDEIKCGKSGTG